MIIKPYQRFHTRKLIAFVTPEGEYIDEFGAQLDPKRVKKNYRCFVAWETARILTAEGRGESLMWNGEHIRWRATQRPEELEWFQRPSDAYVLRMPLYERVEPNLSELGRWRDWLWSYRAIPSTMGGTSMSLLKARLRRPLFTSVQWDKTWLRASAGGIIVNGPAGQGEYRGRLVHYDMPAAYATELGTMRYGGKWWDEPNTSDVWLRHLHRKGVPIMLRARVRIPDLQYGPLPIRPRSLKDYHPLKRKINSMSGKLYPTNKTIQGIWTWEELTAARSVGCKVKILAAWHHSSPLRSPFADWFAAVNVGRDMEGLAGVLAKVTGNALWGMFALDPAIRGRRSIHRKTKGNKAIQIQRLKIGGFPLPAIDLAEIVAGRVRARLYEAMVKCGDDLICAHTDGLWTHEHVRLKGEWRDKEHARELQLLSPQHMRWIPPGSAKPQVMYSGVPYQQSEAHFDKDWREYLGSQEATNAA